LDLTEAANTLATISPYITTAIRRFGNRVLNLTPPAEVADGHLS